MIRSALIPKTFNGSGIASRICSATVLLLVVTVWPVVGNAGFVVSLGLNVPITTTSTADINFGGAAANPFRFQGFFTDSGNHGIQLVDANSGAPSQNLVRLVTLSNRIQLLNRGDSIDSGDLYSGSTKLLHGRKNGNLDSEGNWALQRPNEPLRNLTGYIGVRFAAAGNPSNFHYGWIHYTALTTATSAPYSTGTINGWGYNTNPGESIPAGVPEPSALALVGGLATALAVLNRRRRPS